MKKAIAVLSILLILAIGACCGLFWYGRNLIEQKNTEISNAIEQLNEAQLGTDEKSAEIAGAADKLKAKEQEIQVLHEQCTELNGTIDSLNADIAALQSRLEGMLNEFRTSDSERLAAVEENTTNTVKRFLLMLESKGIDYTLSEESSGSRTVSISDLSGSTYSGPSFRYSVSVRFPADVSTAYFRIEDFMEYDARYDREMLSLCNYINTGMNIKCVYNGEARTISLYYDLPCTDSPLDSELFASVLSGLTDQVRFIYDMAKPYLPLPSFDYSNLGLPEASAGTAEVPETIED